MSMEPERRSRKSRVRNSQIKRKPAKRGNWSGQRARQGKQLKQERQETGAAPQTQKAPSESVDDGVDQLLRLEGLARNFGDKMVRRFSRPSPLTKPWDERTTRRHLAWC